MQGNLARRLIAAGGLAIGVMAVGACSQGVGQGANTAGKAADAPAVAQGATGAGGAAESRGASAASKAASVDAAAVSAGALDQVPAQSGRAVIQTANMTVKVDDVNSAKSRAAEIVRPIGGYVFAEQTSYSERATSVMTLKVPAEQFGTVLDQFQHLGALASQDIKTDDVTSQMIDLNSRITASEESLKKIRELVDKANNLMEQTQLEAEITKRLGDLENLRGQRDALQKKVDLSTIVLTLNGEKDATPAIEEARRQAEAAANAQKPLPGFSDGLHGGWEAFMKFATVAGAVAGAVLPFLPFVVIPVVAWRLLTRRNRRRDRGDVGEGPGSRGSGGLGTAITAPASPAGPGGPIAAPAAPA